MLIFDLADHFLARVFPTLPASGGRFGVMVFRFSIAGSFTVAIAYLSRWYFEEPFLRMKGRFDRHRTGSDAAFGNTYSRGA